MPNALKVCQFSTLPLLSKLLVPVMLVAFQPCPPRFCNNTADSTMFPPPELLTPFDVQVAGQAPPVAVFVMFI